MDHTIIETIQQKITKLYLLYMLIVFPLYYHNNYIDIMEAKRMVYLWGTGAYILVMALLSLGKKHNRNAIMQMTVCTKLLMALALILCLGMIGCPDLWNSFWGYGAKCTGLILYLMGIVAIYLIGKYGEWTTGVTWAMLFGSIIVGCLQVLNRWGVDPLHMYHNLAEEDIPFFISTIGQVNYNAAYDCMVLSVLLIMFMICREKISLIVYGTAIVILFAGSMCCCSNTAYLTIFVMFYVLLFYSRKHVEYAVRLATVFVLLDVAAYIIWGCYLKKKVYLWDTSEMIYNAKLHWFVTTLLVLFALGCILCRYIYGRRKELAEKIWKIYVIICMACGPLGVACTIYFFTNHYNIKAQVLWSSYRMEIWNNCITLFDKSDLWHKLFGWGFNCVYQGLETVGLHKQAGIAIMDAHNLALNSLITSGICGTLAWLVVLGWIFIQAHKQAGWNREVWVITNGIIAYMVQGIFNGPQILSTPMFFMLLGIYMAVLRQMRNKNKEGME